MEVKDNKYDLINGFKSHDKFYNLNNPLVMGVLNVTPDSFYEESRKKTFAEAVFKSNEMIKSGVDIIDIGGVSTRPKADLLSSKEELKRVIPIIQEVSKMHANVLISIDTFRADVAREAIYAGAHIINDVYGGRYDAKMFDTVAELDVPYILMHSRGNAENMQDLCSYKDVVMEVCNELSISIEKLRSKGVKDIFVDPGFGFAKTLEQNYELFDGLPFLKLLNCPFLVGISRKSMIYKLLNTSASESLTGTIALNTISLLKGASIIRVHDVKEAIELRRLIAALKSQ